MEEVLVKVNDVEITTHELNGIISDARNVISNLTKKAFKDTKEGTIIFILRDSGTFQRARVYVYDLSINSFFEGGGKKNGKSFIHLENKISEYESIRVSCSIKDNNLANAFSNIIIYLLREKTKNMPTLKIIG